MLPQCGGRANFSEDAEFLRGVYVTSMTENKYERKTNKLLVGKLLRNEYKKHLKQILHRN